METTVLKNIYKILAIPCLFFIIHGCDDNHAENIINPNNKIPDGPVVNLPTVKIGNQTWTSKNLDVSVFRNGDPIPQAKTMEEWKKLSDNREPAWCYYNFDPSNGIVYGRIYNYYAVKDARQLAPNGYHIPNDREWMQLVKFLDKDLNCGVKMKSQVGWKENGNGTNESGFNGLPGGFCDSWGQCYDLGKKAFWWTVPEPYGRFLLAEYSFVGTVKHDYSEGMYVRCIKEK